MSLNPTPATLISAVDYAGVAVFAASGVLASTRKRMDVVGALALAMATAIGGGTIRDLLIGAPVFWIQQPVYIWIAAAAGAAVFLAVHYIRLRSSLLLIPDAVGLSLYTWIGAEKAHTYGLSATAAVLMGIITGTAGGIIRDVLNDEVPGLFVESELYAVAALAGALALVACWTAGVRQPWPAVVCIALVLILRLAALRWRIMLPGFRGQLPD